MKKIVSKATIILSVILFTLSICAISSIECLRGKFPLHKAIINTEETIYGLNYGNINYLPYKQTPLFYIGLALVILSGIVCFTKTNRFKSLINIVLSLIPTIFVLVTHNYIWFLIIMNIYLFLNILINFSLKNKIEIFTNIVSTVIGILNIIHLIKHLQLTYDPSDIQLFQITLLEMSDITLKLLTLWLVPYTILLIKDIITTYKALRTVN